LYNVPAFLSTTYDTLTATSWRNLTDIYTVHFRTSDVAKPLSISYLIQGDINRSHSSVRTQGNNVTTYASMPVNTVSNVPNVDVALNNLTVTSNTIEIPFTVNTNNNKLSALQLELVYDRTKIKFEEIKSEVPNSWYVFVNTSEGKIRFGGIDKDVKSPIVGTSAPFKLKFSSIESGLDLNTKIRITSNLDASDDKGNQLGVNLNTTTIKLTGYNNF
jgi:hypothetical protein